MRENIKQIRYFNRFYTAHLGLLNHPILESDYSLSEVRVLYEIGEANQVTAQQLSERLKLDKGYLSRLIKLLTKQGILLKVPSSSDGRALQISLSDAGRSLLKRLQVKSDEQIEGFLGRLSPAEGTMLVNAIKT
ncbi:MarR family winged helix-turn-helix transcriptional regulator [Spirosoma radiotolerans]|uniref:MarR family winged helix-turn-helix transcriptional regulator n=1 Tax=Spirosoma radiotolerans TaxID=1379870 RepID=UPI000A55BEFE|nr:MarR family transcriptional regulator [Spirosoma radiotolerans]